MKLGAANLFRGFKARKKVWMTFLEANQKENKTQVTLF